MKNSEAKDAEALPLISLHQAVARKISRRCTCHCRKVQEIIERELKPEKA